MNYLKQILFEMRHQKMMMWVSIGGTALAIFLVMTYFMGEQLKTPAVAPELNRSRIVSGQNIHLLFTFPDMNSKEVSTSLDYDQTHFFYDNLDGVELMSFMSMWENSTEVGNSIEDAVVMSMKNTDENYWKMYDFTFIEGKPYGSTECESGEKVAVISRKVARRLFGTEKSVGKDIKVNGIPYRITGVVKDVNPLLETAYSDIWLPLGPEERAEKSGYGVGDGNIQVKLLLRPGTDVEALKKEVERRYTIYNKQHEGEYKATYHGQPYTDIVVSTHYYGSNTTPDTHPGRTLNFIVYVILLILPAINLSSMTGSRLKVRESELGVRRAFEASKASIVRQLLGENLIITLAGGAIGLICSVLFSYLLSGLFMEFGIDHESSLIESTVKPELGMLFSWEGFLLALLFCFILNLISAFVPAWKAARIQPATAIARNRNN